MKTYLDQLIDEVQTQVQMVYVENLEPSIAKKFKEENLANDPEAFVRCFYEFKDKSKIFFNDCNSYVSYKLKLSNLMNEALKQCINSLIQINNRLERVQGFKNIINKVSSVHKPLNEYDYEKVHFNINGDSFERSTHFPIFIAYTYLQSRTLETFCRSIKQMESFIALEPEHLIYNNWKENPGLKWVGNKENFHWLYKQLSKKLISITFKDFSGLLYGTSEYSPRVVWNGTKAELSELLKWMVSDSIGLVDSKDLWERAERTFIFKNGFLYKGRDMEKNYSYKSKHGGRCNGESDLCCIMESFKAKAR
jgi:hypothetical protein